MPAKVIDWNDPCARAGALSEAYFVLVSGARAASIMTRTMDAEERLTFHKTDAEMLRREMEIAKTECDVLNGRTPETRRRAFVSGYSRPWRVQF